MAEYQVLLERMGEDNGYRVTLEKPVFGELASLDAALAQD